MAAELFMNRRRRAGRLVLEPADAFAAETLDQLRVPPTTQIRAKLTAARSRARNAWFHALLATAADALGDAWTPSTLKMWLKLQCGLVDLYDIDGRRVAVPRSVAFDRMDEGEFSEFCSRAVRVIITRLMPGMREADLRREVEEFLTGRAAA